MEFTAFKIKEVFGDALLLFFSFERRNQDQAEVVVEGDQPLIECRVVGGREQDAIAWVNLDSAIGFP